MNSSSNNPWNDLTNRYNFLRTASVAGKSARAMAITRKAMNWAFFFGSTSILSNLGMIYDHKGKVVKDVKDETVIDTTIPFRLTEALDINI